MSLTNSFDFLSRKQFLKTCPKFRQIEQGWGNLDLVKVFFFTLFLNFPSWKLTFDKHEMCSIFCSEDSRWSNSHSQTFFLPGPASINQVSKGKCESIESGNPALPRGPAAKYGVHREPRTASLKMKLISSQGQKYSRFHISKNKNGTSLEKDRFTGFQLFNWLAFLDHWMLHQCNASKLVMIAIMMMVMTMIVVKLWNLYCWSSWRRTAT